MMIESIDPATLEVLGAVETVGAKEIEELVDNARMARIGWSELTVAERARRVLGVNFYLVAHMNEISRLIAREVGKPVGEAFIAEVYGAIDSTFWYAEHAAEAIGGRQERALGFYNSMNKRSYIVQRPMGVVGVIGPYNYPFIIPFEQMVQALIAGNAVLFKPSSETVLVGEMIQRVFDSLSLPSGLVQTVFGHGSTVGNALVDAVDRVLFTGSTATGRTIMKRAAETLTPVTLELGGKDAMVVLADANLERAVQAARWGTFSNAGQVCASVKRIYLHESIAESFIEHYVEAVSALKQDDPLDEGTDIGAMINAEQLRLVEEMVATAVDEGATVACGGRRNTALAGYFFEPTVLIHCTNEMRCVQEEIFGPVATVLRFAHEDGAVEMVNENRYGLTASIWTDDIAHGEALAQRIRAGTVMLNEVVYTFGLAATPWGGVKDSGFGRSHGYEGFEEFTQPLHINIDTNTDPDPWWMPYDEGFYEYMENFKLIAASMLPDDEKDIDKDKDMDKDKNGWESRGK